MRQEGWPEILGMIIGPTLMSGIMGAVAGIVWSLAVDSSITAGAKWGGIVGAGIVLVLTIVLAPNRNAIRGIGFMFGPLYGIVIVIGLVVWLIRTLVG